MHGTCILWRAGACARLRAVHAWHESRAGKLTGLSFGSGGLNEHIVAYGLLSNVPPHRLCGAEQSHP